MEELGGERDPWNFYMLSLKLVGVTVLV